VSDCKSNDIRNANDHAIFLENFFGTFPIFDQNTEDAELFRIGKSHRLDVDPVVGKRSAGFPYIARLVLQKQRKLFQPHYFLSKNVDGNKDLPESILFGGRMQAGGGAVQATKMGTG